MSSSIVHDLVAGLAWRAECSMQQQAKPVLIHAVPGRILRIPARD